MMAAAFAVASMLKASGVAISAAEQRATRAEKARTAQAWGEFRESYHDNNGACCGEVHNSAAEMSTWQSPIPSDS